MRQKLLTIATLSSMLFLGAFSAVHAEVINADVTPLPAADAVIALLPMGAFAIVSVCFQCFLFLIIICGLTLWIWMLIDVIRRKDGQFPQPQNKDQKLIWLLIVILTSYIGAAIYYFMVYRKAGKAL